MELAKGRARGRAVAGTNRIDLNRIMQQHNPMLLTSGLQSDISVFWFQSKRKAKLRSVAYHQRSLSRNAILIITSPGLSVSKKMDGLHVNILLLVAGISVYFLLLSWRDPILLCKDPFVHLVDPICIYHRQLRCQ